MGFVAITWSNNLVLYICFIGLNYFVMGCSKYVSMLGGSGSNKFLWYILNMIDCEVDVDKFVDGCVGSKEERYRYLDSNKYLFEGDKRLMRYCCEWYGVKGVSWDDVLYFLYYHFNVFNYIFRQ